MWYYCYVLESTIGKTTYIGSTDNLKNDLRNIIAVRQNLLNIRFQ